MRELEDEEMKEEKGKRLIDGLEVADRPDKDCHDRHDLCKFWQSIGECESNRDWMEDHCPVSCDVCNGTMTCIDRHRLCNFWANINECTTNAVWMLANCPRSCKACKGMSPFLVSRSFYCRTGHYRQQRITSRWKFP